MRCQPLRRALAEKSKYMKNSRELIYLDLKSRMEKVGFVLEKEQQPHFQNKRENELKFIHPALEEKFRKSGEKNRANKFYIKDLSDEPNSYIGLTVGKTSPLFKLKNFPESNAIDTYKNAKAWANLPNNPALECLLVAISEYLSLSFDDINNQFYDEVNFSLSLSLSERKEHLAKASKIPKKMIVVTEVYARNADVVAEALIRANGYCELCKKEAPFIRAKDKTPYLEVHHIRSLADGGEDTLDNVFALCPNCHRRSHFG